MNKAIAPFFLVTVYDENGEELRAAEVQGWVVAQQTMRQTILNLGDAANRVTIHQLVGTGRVGKVDFTKKNWNPDARS